MQHPIVRQIQRFIPLITLGFLLFAIIMARHQLHAYRISDIWEIILSVPASTAGLALLFCAGGYLILSLNDWLALHYVRKSLPLAKSMLASFVGFAISHNAGHPMVSGASVRYRFYYALGLGAVDIFKISAFNSLTYGLGVATMLLAAYFAEESQPGVSLLPGHGLLIAAVALVFAFYWLCVLRWRPSITIRNHLLHLPSAPLTCAQIIAGSLDVFFSGMVLHTMISLSAPMPLSDFFIIYTVSLALATLSQVPGGLGIFEGVFLHLAPADYAGSNLLAALILFRIAYYFIPLAIAGALLLFHEMRSHRTGMRLRMFKDSL